MGEPQRGGKGYPQDREKFTIASKSRRQSPSRGRRTKLRLLYFSIASIWGFLVGIALAICCMKQTEGRLFPGIGAYGLLAGAGAVAVIGGLLAAMVYKDVVKRGLR